MTLLTEKYKQCMINFNYDQRVLLIKVVIFLKYKKLVTVQNLKDNMEFHGIQVALSSRIKYM